MAHVEKLKATGVGPMVGHYAREAERNGYMRPNIDVARTGLNYAIGAADADALARKTRDAVTAAKAAHEKNAGKSLRKDANVLADWIVTLPEDCPDELCESFFKTVVRFIQQRYGAECVPGGFVHMDEKTPHVHVPVIPILNGKLQASKVIDRADLKTFHTDLGAAVDKALGVHVSIELDDENRARKELSRLPQAEYKAAKDEIKATEERLEGLQREARIVESEVEALQSSSQGLSESLRCLKNGRNARNREEVLRTEIEGLRSRISAVECTMQKQRAWLVRAETVVEQTRELLGKFIEAASDRLNGCGLRFAQWFRAATANGCDHELVEVSQVCRTESTVVSQGRGL